MEAAPLTLAGVASRGIRTDGDPSLPAFLFLHGFSDSADGWRRVQRRLESHEHRSLAVDQPSHGHAETLAADRSAIDQFVEFAAAAATELGQGSPVVVVGNSLGGGNGICGLCPNIYRLARNSDCPTRPRRLRTALHLGGQFPH